MQFVAEARLWFPDGEEHFLGTTKKGRPVWDGYQADRLKALYPYCPGADTAVDGGAHVGLLTRKLAERFRVVLAFEPHPENYACLVKNTAALPNVRCFNVALAEVEGELGIETAPTANSGDRQVVPGGNGVRAVRLDDIPLDGPVDLVKLDVQGYEAQVLRGALGTLQDFAPALLVECEPATKLRVAFNNDRAVEKLLTSLGASQVGEIGADRLYAFGEDGCRPYEKYTRLGAYHWETYASGKTKACLDAAAAYMAEALHHHGSVLDVGCGDGLFVHLLQQAGLQAYGIDSNTMAVALARGKEAELDRAMAVDHANFFRLEGGRHYDAVSMLDVLEHVCHQELVLEKARSMAKHLYILNPDPNGSGWHTREFTEEQLVQFVTGHGYRLVHSERHQITSRNWKTFCHFVAQD